MLCIDAHSHLNYEEDREVLLQTISQMQEKNITTITVGTHRASSQRAIDLAIEFPEITTAIIGHHPAHCFDEIFDISKYEKMLEREKQQQNNNKTIVGIGECGFDFYHDSREKSELEQEKQFRLQIELALAYNLPLMLHIRSQKDSFEAYEKTLQILDEYKDSRLRGNAHFFTGTTEIAREFLKRDFCVSFTGVITFVKDYDTLIREIPLEKMLIETDSPFVSPAPYRKEKAKPWMVIEVARRIAEIKEIEIEKVYEQTKENTQNLFNVFR
jgi:TatD DNase family protein